MNDNIELLQASETEFFIGENQISLIEGNIIYIIAYGVQTAEIALSQKKMCEMLILGLEGKINFLIDLNNCGKSSREAREMWKEFSESENTNKVAIFGLNRVSKIIASFVIRNFMKEDLRFFMTKKESIDWILT